MTGAAMDLRELDERQMARIYGELGRLRDCLRPSSVERSPSFEPFEAIWTADDRISEITPSVERILGWEPSYTVKISPGLELFRPGDTEGTYAHWYRCLMGRAARDVEFRLAHADGTGYVWLVDDMWPRRRRPDGRVEDVLIRTFDVTALRARELDFVIDCLRKFHFRRDREVLRDLGVPQLIDEMLPACRGEAKCAVLPFPKLNGADGPALRRAPRQPSRFPRFRR